MLRIRIYLCCHLLGYGHGHALIESIIGLTAGARIGVVSHPACNRSDWALRGPYPDLRSLAENLDITCKCLLAPFSFTLIKIVLVSSSTCFVL